MPGKIKVNFKMPPESAAEKFARRQAELRKKRGAPDPKYYKKLAVQKQKEIDDMRKEAVNEADRIPRESGQPAKSKKHSDLYTDEDPKGTIHGLKFTTDDDARASVSKIKNSGRTHAHKIQAAVAMEQRAKVAGKAEAAGVYRKYINSIKKEDVDQLDEMPESSMKTREVHAHLKKSGWSLKRTGGGHDVYSHPKSEKHITVPRHKQLKAPLIRGILKTSKVSEETEIEEQLHKKGRFVSEPVKKPFKSATIVSSVKEDTIQEGRPSQRHPLEGHDYHKKSNAELIGIAKDAHAAAEAMKGHSPRAENKYRDQANDSATVRYFRQKNGMPDWYKKKYGHMKEEVEYLEEKNEPTNPALWSKAKSLAKQKFDVYPSAYANGWAAKWYKGKGGGWKSVSESVNEAADDEVKPVLSRKAQIVKDAAKKKDNSEKFQKDPELSSEIHKT